MQVNIQRISQNLNSKEMKSTLLDTRTEQKREGGVECDSTLTL
jgi:hypothetical protein